MNWEKVLVHANGGVSTLRSLNNLKKFNYTKIDKSTVLRSRPNLKMTYAFTDFSMIEIFLFIPTIKSSETCISKFSSNPQSFMAKSFLFWKNNCLN